MKKPMKVDEMSNREIKAALAAAAWLDEEIMRADQKKATIEVTKEDLAKRSIGWNSYFYWKDFQPGLDVAYYYNGGGDEIAILLEDDRVLITGFDHESNISPHGRDDGYYMWPGMLEGAPADLVKILLEEPIGKPEFPDESIPWPIRTLVTDDCVTFALWRETSSDPFMPSKTISYPKSEDGGRGWLFNDRAFTADRFWKYCQEEYSDDVAMTEERVHEVYAICSELFE